MYQRVVLTSGISLFNRQNSYGEFVDKVDFLKRNGPKIESTLEDESKAKEAWMEVVRNHTREDIDPKKVSAEYSLLYSLHQGKRLASSPYITILHTQSFGGELAAKSLEYIIERKFEAHVRLQPIPDFDNLSDRIRINRGLGNFMGLLSQELQKGEPRSTCFSPIGGYKIFTSLGYLVGAFHGYSTAYLHEGDQVLHEIPAIPIHIDEHFIHKHSDLLRRLYRKYRDDYASLSDFSEQEKEVLTNHQVFFSVEEDLVTLNPFALFLLEQPQFQFITHPKIFLTNEARKEIESRPGSKEEILEQIRKLVWKYDHNDRHQYDAELYHDREFKNIRIKDFFLYKGDNDPLFRAMWRMENGDVLYIRYIWLNHETYDRDVEKKTVFRDPGNLEYQNYTDQVYGDDGGDNH